MLRDICILPEGLALRRVTTAVLSGNWGQTYSAMKSHDDPVCPIAIYKAATDSKLSFITYVPLAQPTGTIGDTAEL